MEANFNKTLGKILDLLHIKDDAKARFIQRFQSIVAQRFTNALLEKLGDNEEAKTLVQRMVDTETDEEFSESIVDFYTTLSKYISQEEQKEMYTISNVATFLEVIEPIIENSSDEVKEKIASPLAEDTAFSAMYNEWRQN